MLGEKSSSEIYEVASKKLDRSKRQIRNYLDSLISKGYIEYEIMEDFHSLIKPRIFKLRRRSEDGNSNENPGKEVLQTE
jgi:predicted ArsR family transcriptional regulator